MYRQAVRPRSCPGKALAEMVEKVKAQGEIAVEDPTLAQSPLFNAPRLPRIADLPRRRMFLNRSDFVPEPETNPPPFRIDNLPRF